MTYDHVVGFGEAMLRLSTPVGAAVEAAARFDATVGGAELNGLIAATRAGVRGTWVSSLPDNPLGALVHRHARANGVAPVLVGAPGAGAAATHAPPGRLGVYFIEFAASPRPIRITYDRVGSTFARLEPGAVDWAALLSPDTCLYVSGITPALGPGPRACTDEALRAAREVGATVALDVNYRAALWTRIEAARWLEAVIGEVDVLAAGPTDLEHLGLRGEDLLAEVVAHAGLSAALATTKHVDGEAVDLELRVVAPDVDHTTRARATVVDPIGAGDALFGTFVALLPTSGVKLAAERALGAAVTCYGLHGDALVVDAWDASDGRGVIR